MFPFFSKQTWIAPTDADDRALDALLRLHGIRNFRASELGHLPTRGWGGPPRVLPRREMWPRIVPALILLQRVRDEIALPIRLVSTFRPKEYNDHLRSIGRGAAKRSEHIEFRAVDSRCDALDVREYAAVVERMCRRYDAAGVPTGFSQYGSFVHHDLGGRKRPARWATG